MKSEDYATRYQAETGQPAPDNVLEFYSRIAERDAINAELEKVRDAIEGERERQAIQQSERERQAGIRIFRRGTR